MTAPAFKPVLDFWFGLPAEAGQFRKVWFQRDEAFDAEIATRFATVHEAALAGAHDAWAEKPHGALALVIALDQFPRNLHRGSARAYAADAKAREVARMAVLERGFDRGLAVVERLFLYLPFEHGEALADQDLCVALFEGMRGEPGAADLIRYAWEHRAVIRRFGRFPHRNADLGRASTPAEEAFLAAHGRGF